MLTQPISATYYINPSHQSVCVFPSYCNMDAQSVSRQQLNKYVPVNMQQWKLYSLWAMLGDARLLTTESVFYVVRATAI
jgi:hypothetical protein